MIIANNQIGSTVFFFVPIPNSLNEPSGLYKNDGFISCINAKITTNIKIEIEVIFFLIMDLFIIN